VRSSNPTSSATLIWVGNLIGHQSSPLCLTVMVISPKKVLAGKGTTSEKNNERSGSVVGETSRYLLWGVDLQGHGTTDSTRQKQKRKRQIEDEEEELNKSEEDSEGIDSDTLDVPRKKSVQAKSRERKKSSTVTNKRKRNLKDIEVELEEGEELVGVVVQAPETGLVPAGQISQNTLDFLTQLQDSKRNNRAWYV